MQKRNHLTLQLFPHLRYATIAKLATPWVVFGAAYAPQYKLSMPMSNLTYTVDREILSTNIFVH